jgi:cyclic dehypoxanthinyl futalosine synthase
MIQPILEKALSGIRLNFDDGVQLFRSDDILSLGQAADAIRQRIHPEGCVTYIIDRNINYTNICSSGCKFCAFYRRENDPDAYVLSKAELGKKIQETIDLGGVLILMQGGLHPALKLEWYEDLLRWIKSNYKIHVHAFSPPEIVFFAKINKMSLQEIILRLKEAGLDSIPGGGAEILTDRSRGLISPGKCTADEWLEVMRQAHNTGLRTTATMMFGHVESYEERVEHLIKVRDLQDETGGFTAFICWTFQPNNTRLAHIPPVGSFEYLKTLAISRLMLDNFANLQASWVTQGPKIGQIALKFGANDLGGTMIEENVVRATGAGYHHTPPDEMTRWIEEMGYVAKQRDFYYKIYENLMSIFQNRH